MFRSATYVLFVAVLACLSAISATSEPTEAYPPVVLTTGRVLVANAPGLNQAVASNTKWASKLIQNIKLRVGNQSPADAFKILQLDKLGLNLFLSPGFLKWEKFVRKAEQNAPETTMFSILATHNTDEALATMFAAAKEVDSTRSIATKLEGVQLSNWANADKSSTFVFKALELHKTKKLFESPAFNTWATYVSSRAQQSSREEVIFVKLLKQYGDAALAKMIAAASKVDSTRNLAIELRTLQFQYWYARGETTKTVNRLIRMTANSDKLTKTVARDFRRFYHKAKSTELHA